MNHALSVGFFLSASLSMTAQDRTGEVQEIAPGVYFHQGDIEKGHCNQGWVMFENFVLVIDGNYPSGAEISADGRQLILTDTSDGQSDILALSVHGDRTAKPVLAMAFDEIQPSLSPDGRRLAYVSNESGHNEVYVQAYPELGAKTLISTDGGKEPVWSTDGTELFYRNGDDVLAVRVDSPSPGKPEVLFRRAFRVGSDDLVERQYDVSPDGRYFVMVQRGGSNQFNVVLNFLDEIEEKIQTR